MELFIFDICSCTYCFVCFQKKHACGFKCPTYSACKHLWKCAVEQQYFFTWEIWTCSCSDNYGCQVGGGGIKTHGTAQKHLNSKRIAHYEGNESNLIRLLLGRSIVRDATFCTPIFHILDQVPVIYWSTRLRSREYIKYLGVQSFWHYWLVKTTRYLLAWQT